MKYSSVMKLTISVVATAAFCLVALSAQAVSMTDIEMAATCKVEGDKGADCATARGGVLKYARECKAEGTEGMNCQRAREVVVNRKLGEAPAPGVMPVGAGDKAMAAPAAAAPAAKAGGADKELEFAMHCKAEGADGERCMKSRDALKKFAANCKEEGADGQRCHMVRQAQQAK